MGVFENLIIIKDGETQKTICLFLIKMICFKQNKLTKDLL